MISTRMTRFAAAVQFLANVSYRRCWCHSLVVEFLSRFLWHSLFRAIFDGRPKRSDLGFFFVCASRGRWRRCRSTSTATLLPLLFTSFNLLIFFFDSKDGSASMSPVSTIHFHIRERAIAQVRGEREKETHSRNRVRERKYIYLIAKIWISIRKYLSMRFSVILERFAFARNEEHGRKKRKRRNIHWYEWATSLIYMQ